MDSNQSKKKRNKWSSLINIPIQMGVLIYVFSWIGNWLDIKYINSNNWFVKAFTILGVLLAFYNLNRQLKEINSQNDWCLLLLKNHFLNFLRYVQFYSLFIKLLFIFWIFKSQKHILFFLYLAYTYFFSVFHC